jgi:hypothetical protein
MRIFQHDGMTYALTMPGTLSRSADGLGDFETGPTLFNPNMRHAAVLKRDGALWVFWTQVGDAPERILLSRIAGLVRQRVLAHYLGLSDAADAFTTAFRIPNFLQNLFGEGVLSASFIPVYARLLAEEPGGFAGRARWRRCGPRHARVDVTPPVG